MRSTHAAETLALVECAGTAVFMKKVISQVANCNLLPIICYTDNKSLLDSVKSSKNADDKRLRIDLAVLNLAPPQQSCALKVIITSKS